MTKWQTTNYKGEQVTWYSADVVEKLKKEVKQIGSDFIKKGDYARELEQENENLKQQLEIDKNQINYFIEESERLKEENKTLEQFLSKEPLALQALQKGYASYKKSTDVFYEMIKKYKQTLQEIKEIAEHEIKELTDSAINGGRYLEILDLITKAEEE